MDEVVKTENEICYHFFRTRVADYVGPPQYCGKVCFANYVGWSAWGKGQKTFLNSSSFHANFELWYSGLKFDRNLKWIEPKFDQNSRQGEFNYAQLDKQRMSLAWYSASWCNSNIEFKNNLRSRSRMIICCQIDPLAKMCGASESWYRTRSDGRNTTLNSW